jgi:hypothetical protein
VPPELSAVRDLNRQSCRSFIRAMHALIRLAAVTAMGSLLVVPACGGDTSSGNAPANGGAGGMGAAAGRGGSAGSAGAHDIGLGGSGGSRAGAASSTVDAGAGGAAEVGGAPAGQAGAAGDAASVGYPAPFPSPPQVVTFSGPILSAPKFVPVFFAGDDPTLVGELKDFAAKLGASQYWAATTAEYGVGAGSAAAPVMLGETAARAIDDNAIQTWLADKVNSDDLAWPVADANTVYVLHYPVATKITQGGFSSCSDFAEYHSSITLNAAHDLQQVAYAVVPHCESFNGLTGIDELTAAESHALLNAATDPYPNYPAYARFDADHIYWETVVGGVELAEMCAHFANPTLKPTDLGYTVQRAWSNRAAKAGSDPCRPELANEVYFNAAPVLPDSIETTVLGQTRTVPGVAIAVGSSKTIDLELFSSADTQGPWNLTALDVSHALAGPELLSLSLNRSSGVNGDKLRLTITVLAAGPQYTETFLVRSMLGSEETLWFGIVGN